MSRISDNKIVLITRQTRLEELVARYNTLEQAKFYIEHMGSDFSDYLLEDEQYRKVLGEAVETLSMLGRLQVVNRRHVPNFIFAPEDIVVVIGQDGLVANTMKYLSGQPLIGVNPDPERWDGVLLPFSVKDLMPVTIDVFRRKRPISEVNMAKATLTDGQTLYAVNDLFVGRKTHVSARYRIFSSNREEDQSSSGIIISTGLGSTGWLKSVMAGAEGILKEEMGIGGLPGRNREIPWNADYLKFAVREPFPSRTTAASLVYGTISKSRPMKILSQMPENGVIFSDGMEEDFLVFQSGIEADITLAEKKGMLVV